MWFPKGQCQVGIDLPHLVTVKAVTFLIGRKKCVGSSTILLVTSRGVRKPIFAGNVRRQATQSRTVKCWMIRFFGGNPLLRTFIVDPVSNTVELFTDA